MNMLELNKFKNESMSFQIKNFADGIACALNDSMEGDPSVVTFGLGTTDPKTIFGTTRNLKEKFGGDRVFDTPVSENATTGMAVGLAISGYKPILTHQRLDFSLLSIDQIVNSAAKWNFMFGGQQSVPLVIRMIIGQGWGQGPTPAPAQDAQGHARSARSSRGGTQERCRRGDCRCRSRVHPQPGRL